MDSQERIEQIVVIALLVLLAIGCLTVLRPFLSALLWALILSFSSWPLASVSRSTACSGLYAKRVRPSCMRYRRLVRAEQQRTDLDRTGYG
jgi:hypothetical protein